jgi:DNA (cytosine-5)-methyltransferase 1
MDIIDNKKPRYVILENVANLENHDNGRTAKIIKASLDEANYYCHDGILSPHQFGIPHHRPRYFIVGIHRSVNGYREFRFPDKLDLKCDALSLYDGSDDNDLSEDLQRVLDHWTVFMESLPEGVTPPSPTWSMEFGRNYPLEGINPLSRRSTTRARLCEILESEGIFANPNWPKKEIIALFPPYIRKMKEAMPKWKRRFIQKNRKFWDEYGSELPEGWLEETRELDETFQKFEWHVGADAERDVMAHMIHVRPSGIRVSRLNRIPALVAIAQIPIIGPWRRRLTVREAARAQSFKDDFKLHEKDSVSFKQLGNSVNVEVVKRVMLGIQDVETISDLDVMEGEAVPDVEAFQLDNQ